MSRIVYLTRRKLFRVRNSLMNALYPFGMIASVISSLIMALYVLFYREQCTSIFCVGWLISAAYWFVSHLPLIDWMPPQLQLLYAGSIAGFLFALLIATIERYALRALLHWHGWMVARRGAPSLGLRAWGAAVKILSGGRPLLYSFQGCLPRLPVPAIRATVDKYLESVEALQTSEQFERTRALAETFVSKEAPKLQRLLMLKSWWVTNYVSDWWLRFVYLRGRSSIMINSNYYVTDSLVPLQTDKPAARAAKMIHEFLEFKRLLDHELIEPIKMANLVPMCMDQYRRTFCTTRIPGRDEDSLTTAEQSKHIVVWCKGNFYSLPCYEAASGRLLSPGELEDQLALIQADASANPLDGPAAQVAVLTAWNRTRWAEARGLLLSNSRNKRTLHEVESAMFHVILDDAAPTDMSAQGHLNIHGSGADRWFDKSLTLIVYANARIGMNVEHSWADALVIAHLWEHVVLSGESRGGCYDASGYNLRAANQPRTALTLSKKMPWDVPRGSRIESAIIEAHGDARRLIDDLELEIFHHAAYGKERIKVFGVSPDSFVQMAMQLAYFKDSGGKFVLTYEAASVRLFRDGRTETIRSCTRESVAFVKAMNDTRLAKSDKRHALKQACEKHASLTVDAMAGAGIDRHLFALYVVSLGVKVESEFLKAALAQPWVLSTSQQPIQQTQRWDPSRNKDDASRMSPGGGFGPVADDGYGVSYLVAGDGGGIYFHVSCKNSAANTSSRRFIGHLQAAFEEMRAIFDD